MSLITQRCWDRLLVYHHIFRDCSYSLLILHLLLPPQSHFLLIISPKLFFLEVLERVFINLIRLKFHSRQLLLDYLALSFSLHHPQRFWFFYFIELYFYHFHLFLSIYPLHHRHVAAYYPLTIHHHNLEWLQLSYSTALNRLPHLENMIVFYYQTFFCEIKIITSIIF